MNYRHAYHAGNFADVLKHATLALVIEHMKLKPAPFRVIDTHAGIGLYDLASVEAGKTGEWMEGIGRILAAPPKGAVADVLAPYLDVVRACGAAGAGDVAPLAGSADVGVGIDAGAAPGLRYYPGSPLIARRLLRRGDVLVVNELHEEDRAALARLFAGDEATRVLGLDGWTAIKSLLPPRERRGIVLVDPPFEQPGELARLSRAVAETLRRFATGTVLLWYPIKDPRQIAAFHRDVVGLAESLGIGRGKLIAAELMIRGADDPDRLNGTGLVVLNPPFTLSGKLELLLPYLATTLARDGRGRASVRLLASGDAG